MYAKAHLYSTAERFEGLDTLALDLNSFQAGPSSNNALSEVRKSGGVTPFFMEQVRQSCKRVSENKLTPKRVAFQTDGFGNSHFHAIETADIA